MQRKELGIAVVGAGRIGTLRARLAAKHPSVNFLAVSDRDPARARSLAEQAGADFHSGDNIEIISRPEVNAVIVSTPEGQHAAAVCKALELGKPVLVEKPIALTLADAEAAAGLPERREYGVGIVEGERNGLLDQHRLAEFQRLANRGGVLAFGSRDDHRIDFGPRDDFDVVPRVKVGAGLLRERTRARRIAVRNREKIHRRMFCRKSRAQRTDSARAHHCNAKFFELHRFSPEVIASNRS